MTMPTIAPAGSPPTNTHIQFNTFPRVVKYYKYKYFKYVFEIHAMYFVFEANSKCILYFVFKYKINCIYVCQILHFIYLKAKGPKRPLTMQYTYKIIQTIHTKYNQ